MTRQYPIFCLLLMSVMGVLSATSQVRAAAVETPAQQSMNGSVVYASTTGAAIDSNLFNGGGTDDTAVLQQVLDRANRGRAVHLVVDGPALISGINVYGNTTIECTAGGGFYLEDHSDRAMIRNAHRSRNEVVDKNIEIRGCFLNGNRENQRSADIARPDLPMLDPMAKYPSNKEADGTFLSGLQFLGVDSLRIEKTTLWNIRAFGALIANATRVTIRDVLVDHGGSSDEAIRYVNTDGLHFKGPLHFLTVENVRLRVGDDGIGLNADDYDTDDLTVRNDFGPYVRQGPITDVTINGIQFMDCMQGIRLLSSRQRIDRVSISNLTGTVKGGYILNLGHWMNPISKGNFGSIVISNVNVDRVNWPTSVSEEFNSAVRKLAKLGKEFSSEYDGGAWPPSISVNAHVETLGLLAFTTKAIDGQAVLRIGPDAEIRSLTTDLNIYDPLLQSTPLKLEDGSHIGNWYSSLKWQGSAGDQGKNPLARLGGTVEQLHWVNTPPVYVCAEWVAGNTVVVTFSQAIKAVDLSAGVSIQVEGRSVVISKALRSTGHPDALRYVLRKPVKLADRITWAYDSTDGSIQNLDGTALGSVTAKLVEPSLAPRL